MNMSEQFAKTSQQKLGRYAQRFTLSNTLDTIDLFKKPLPAFNMRGRSHVPSFCGAFASVLVLMIVTLYGLSKFFHLIMKHNPNIASWVEQGTQDKTETINF